MLLSTSERLPHTGVESYLIFPCLVNSFARLKLGEVLKSDSAGAYNSKEVGAQEVVELLEKLLRHDTTSETRQNYFIRYY